MPERAAGLLHPFLVLERRMYPCSVHIGEAGLCPGLGSDILVLPAPACSYSETTMKILKSIPAHKEAVRALR
jgi:hypothetical protein